MCIVTICRQRHGTEQGTLPFFSTVSRWKLPQKVTLVLLWMFAMAGDIMGYDSWGLLLIPQWVEVKEAAEYSNLARCQGAPYLVQEKYAVQVLVLLRWRHSAWADVPIGRCVARAVWMAPE